jgi:hypothetical protein
MRPALRRFIELQVAMALGALACLISGRIALAAADISTVYRPGTLAYFVGDVFFLSAPAIAWMTYRTARDPGIRLGLAMLLPIGATVVVGQALGADHLLWLVNAMYPLMSLGALAYLLRPEARGVAS